MDSEFREKIWMNKQSLNFILMHSYVHLYFSRCPIGDRLLRVMVHCGGSDKHDRL